VLYRAFVASGVAAAIAILSLAVVVIDRTPNPPSSDGPVANDQAQPGESAVPDPAARGVVILSSDGQLYTYTPDGESFGTASPAPFESGISPDGAWQALMSCTDATCALVIVPAGVSLAADAFETHAVQLDASFAGGEWSRSGSAFAALDQSGSLYLVEPATRATRVVQACCVTAYAWTADDQLLIGGEGKWGTYWLSQAGMTENIKGLANLASPITRFYESPDALQFAFAQSGADGLGMMTIDTRSQHVNDYGVLHDAPDTGGPQFAIAWSHDQRFVAIGPVSAPYSLYVLDTQSGKPSARYDFEEGYAGELVWSPTANHLAVGTYSPDRQRHEVYVVNATDDTAPRHLLGGCRIVWSPDGQFLAAKTEPHVLGATAVNVDTGHHWQLAGLPGLTPVAWGTDEAAAMAQLQAPGRSAAVLGK